MIKVASHEAARAARIWGRTGDGLEAWVDMYFGRTAAMPADADEQRLGELYPVAFMIEQPPHSTASAHYHHADQFQVFVYGNGHLGRHEVGPFRAQYARAYTPYGPIVAGGDGVQYLTLRNGWDPGSRFMPQSRDELRATGRRPRAVVSEPVTPLTESELGATRQPSRETVIAPGTDGLGGWLHVLPAGEQLQGPNPATGRGQYWVMLAGTAGGPQATSLLPLSCCFVPPDEQPFSVTAGDTGAQILILQFPLVLA